MPKRSEQSKHNLDLSVLGSSGLKQFGGIIDEEFHPKLRGAFGPKVYREMADNSSVVGAIRHTIKALVRSVKWWMKPADNSDAATEQAEFVEGCMLDMSMTFEDFISEALSFLEYGWSYFEIVYKLRKGMTEDPTTNSEFDDGKIGWRKFGLRPQDTLDHWEFDDSDGGLRGMFQSDIYSGKQAFIPIEKSLLFRTEIWKGNPEGRSIYRNAVIDYYYLKRIQEIEAIGIERDMTGLLTMEVPIDMLQADADANTKALLNSLKTMLGQLKRDEREYAIVPCEVDRKGQPTGFKLKLLSTGGRRQIDTPAVKDYYKVNILQSVLAQFIQLGMSGVGSFALASSQTNLFAVALGNFMDTIASVFNRFAIDRLMELNGVDHELRPELVHGDIETPPLAEIASYVQALAASGMLPDDKELQRKLLEIANLPQPVEEEVEGMTKTRLVRKLNSSKVVKSVPGPLRQLGLPLKG